MVGGLRLLISSAIAAALLATPARSEADLPASAQPTAANARPANAAPAAQNEHATHARLLEDLGKTAEAAHEYEAAFSETHAPEFLYRLALCRRVLGEFAAAREALRGYLRESPDGSLRDEVERQLAQLAVLIEARGLQQETAAKKKSARAKGKSPPAITEPARAPTEIVSIQHEPPAAGDSSPQTSVAPSNGTNAPSNGKNAPTPNGVNPPTPNEVNLAASSGVNAAASSGANAAVPNSSNLVEAPTEATAVPHDDQRPSSWRPAIPWLAGGAVVLGAAGTVLCVSAHSISSDLDSRAASGDLTAADQPRYSRARVEGVAGTALIGLAAVALAAIAVIAW